MKLDNNQQAFLALVRAGLWEKDVLLALYEPFDIKEVYRLAQEQAVAGLVAAGLEHVKDVKLPKEDILLLVGQTLQLEQRNLAMNVFLSSLIDRMREADIYTILVKGQGVAQCYERPLWRACGDIDLLFDDDNYYKAKSLLLPIAERVHDEDKERKHLGVSIKSWEVELHGTLRTNLGRRIDTIIDEVQRGIFQGNYLRKWRKENTCVLLPSVNDDIILIFSHILQHFFIEGIGLRQICDWCRLLWSYRNEIDLELLESRLRMMGVMTEWKAFAFLAVNEIGMPNEAMPFNNASYCWKDKSYRILTFVMETGNFGHNRNIDYYHKYPFLIYKTISLWKNSWDCMRYFMIFPKDAVRIWFVRFREGVKLIAKGK